MPMTVICLAFDRGFCLVLYESVISRAVTMEEIVFALKHHWMTVDYEPFELYGIV